MFITRLVSIQDFGEYSQFTIFTTYLLLITEFGYNEYILVKAKKENNLDFLLTNFMFISLITFILISIVLLFFNQTLLLFLVLLKVYLDTYLSKLILSYYQFEQKFNVYSKLNILYSVLILFFVFLLKYLNFSIENIVLTVDLFLLMNIAVLSFKSNISINLLNLKKILPCINKEFSFYAFSSITIPIYMLMPLFIMTFYVSKEDIAIFYLAYTISSVMLLISISINQQYLAKLIHNKSGNFYQQIKYPILILLGFNLFAFFVFYVFGEYILISLLNKPEYTESNNYILLLMVSNIFQSISGLLALFFISNNLMKKKLNIHLEFIGLSIFLSYILIVNFGLIGVVYTYIIIYLYGALRYLRFIRGTLNA
jgi:O-antigen/teichoic acid export membrane protein